MVGNIILIGFMGCGKTSVGQKLALELGRPFVDTDNIVCHNVGASIADIFLNQGETFFRRLESEALREACSQQGAVIATGGGVVKDSGNRALMRASGTVIYIRVTAECACARTEGDTSRPLLAQSERRMETVRALLNERAPLYEQCCHMSIKADALSPEEAASQIIRLAFLT